MAPSYESIVLGAQILAVGFLIYGLVKLSAHFRKKIEATIKELNEDQNLGI